ncbi:hypothetical protein [Clostridium guangxiense]|nr:hypothetical protein [Clostridium guangxiense]MCD2345800.1 hypothetical protein [Clostridium guangxiense]
MNNEDNKNKEIRQNDNKSNEKKNFTRDINSEPPAGTKPKSPKKQG